MTSEPQAAVSACSAVSRKSSCAATAAANAFSAAGDCRLRDRPRCDRQRRVVAQRRPVDQRLPYRLLARGQRRRVVGAIADEVGAGVVGGLGDDLLALRARCGRSRSRRAGSAASSPGGSRPAARPIPRRLRRPERSLGTISSCLAGVRIGLPSSATPQPPVGRRASSPVCTRASCRSIPARRTGPGNRAANPKNSQSPAHMRRQRRGDATACRLRDAGSRGCGHAGAAGAPPRRPASCAPAPPYLPSPRIGVPSAAQWARSWCVRPVTGSSASQLARSPA